MQINVLLVNIVQWIGFLLDLGRLVVDKVTSIKKGV